MKLELNQVEIEAALIEYVGSQGISISDKSITVDMVAGRGANGFTAHITIERDQQTAEPSPVDAGFPADESTDTTAAEATLDDKSPLFN